MEKKISALERDIKILSDIIEGRMENYTKHPIPVLSKFLKECEQKLESKKSTKPQTPQGGL